jgi:hypothetical protein
VRGRGYTISAEGDGVAVGESTRTAEA